MCRHVSRLAGIAAIIATMMACSNKTSAPASPTPIADNTSALVSALNSTVPTPVSPVNNERVSASRTTGPTLTASVAAMTITPQYRFRVVGDNGTVAQDSGLVSGLTWTVPVLLTPSAKYTWNVRAEYQGLLGPWSASGSFVTPEPLPAYTRPIGNWEQCGSLTKKLDLVTCVHAAVKPTDTVSLMEMTKRVAWLLRGEGAGLLIKGSGENIIVWQGYSFSASRICYSDGHIFKLVIDAGIGGLNAPTYADNDFVDRSLYVPAIDPSKP